MDTSLFNSLSSFIYFNTEVLKKISEKEYKSNESINGYSKVNINNADSRLLGVSLGLDKKFSERVIKYRNLLGGFSDKNQFNEIYGIQKVQYDLLVENVFIDTSLLRKININRADEQSLVRHPYLNEYYARAILKYRKYAGQVRSVNELLNNNILNKEIYFRIRPYLTVN
jgi:DNA uptake protein ComE-like DNA-binding protein